MLVSFGADMYLVMHAMIDLSFVAQLYWSDELLGYAFTPSSFAKDLVVTTWEGMLHHPYAVCLIDYTLVFAVEEGQSPLDYILRHTVHLHSASLLRKAFCNCGVGAATQHPRLLVDVSLHQKLPGFAQ